MLSCSSKTGSSPQHKRSSYNRNMTSSLLLLHSDGVKAHIASKTYHCRAPRDLIVTSMVLVYLHDNRKFAHIFATLCLQACCGSCAVL